MLKNISWSSYLSITAAITAIYYFLIVVIFYRNEITKLFFSGNSDFINTPAKEKRQSRLTNSNNDSEVLHTSGQNEKEDEIESSQVHELMNELNKVFKKSSDKKFLKEELILALQLTLKNYSVIKRKSFPWSYQ